MSSTNQTGAETDPNDIPSVAEIVRFVENRLDPKRAARYRNGDRAALSVTPIYEAVRVGADIVPLALAIGNRHAAVYVRVSMEQQVEDGYSLGDQIARGIQVCMSHGDAFAVYSDAGLGGGLPYDDPQLIRRLAEAKAEYYRDAFESILLGPYAPYTEQEKAGARHYLEEKVAAELRDFNIDDQIDTDQFRAGMYRPALTVAIERLSRIHKFLAGDLSRIARSQYLLADICEKMDRHRVQIVGTIESLDYLQKRGLGERTLAFVLSVAAEQRLREVRRHSLRGIVAALQAGKPAGHLPHWLERDMEGRAVFTNNGTEAATMRKAADDVVSGRASLIQIARRLQEAGVPTARGGQSWSKRAVQFMLMNESLVGVHRQFGMSWRILPPVLSQPEFDALQARLVARRADFPAYAGRPIHLMTDLLKCAHCGLAMTYRMQTGGRGHVYSCDPNLKGRPSNGHIVTLSAPDVESFFAELFSLHADAVLQRYRESKQHDALRDEIRQLEDKEAEIANLTRRKEGEIEIEAAALARQIGLTRADRLAEALRDERLGDLLGQQERVEREIADRNYRLATLPPPVNVRTVEDRLRAWATLQTAQKNEVLKILLREIRYVDDPDSPHRGWLTPVTNTAEAAELPPVPIRIIRYVDGRAMRRLAGIDEYVLSTFPAPDA